MQYALRLRSALICGAWRCFGDGKGGVVEGGRELVLFVIPPHQIGLFSSLRDIKRMIARMLVNPLNAIDTVSNIFHRNSEDNGAGDGQDALRLQKNDRAEHQRWLAENQARGERKREALKRVRTSLGSTANDNGDGAKHTENVPIPVKNSDAQDAPMSAKDSHAQDTRKVERIHRDPEFYRFLDETQARGKRRNLYLKSSQAAMKSTVNSDADDTRNTEDVSTPAKDGHVVGAEQPKRREVEQGSSKAQPILKHVNEVEASSMTIETRPTSHEKVYRQTKNDTKKKILNKESLAKNSHTPNRGDDAVKPVTNNNRGPGLEKARLEMIARAEERRRSKVITRAGSTSATSAAISPSIASLDAEPVTAGHVAAPHVTVNPAATEIEEEPKRVTYSRSLANSNNLQTQPAGRPLPKKRKADWELLGDTKAQKYTMTNPTATKEVPALFLGESGLLKASRPKTPRQAYSVQWEAASGTMKIMLTKDTLTSYRQPREIAEGTFQVRLLHAKNQQGDLAGLGEGPITLSRLSVIKAQSGSNPLGILLSSVRE